VGGFQKTANMYELVLAKIDLLLPEIGYHTFNVLSNAMRCLPDF